MANDVIDFHGDYYQNFFVETNTGYYTFEQWGGNTLTKINTTKNLKAVKQLAEDVIILEDIDTNDFYFIEQQSHFNKLTNNTPDYNGITDIRIGDYSELTFKNSSGQFEYHNLSDNDNGVFNFTNVSNIEKTHRHSDGADFYLIKTKDDKLYASTSNNFDYVEIADNVKMFYTNHLDNWRRGSDDQYMSGASVMFVKNDKTQFIYHHPTTTTYPLTVDDNGTERVVGEIVEEVTSHGHYGFYRTTNELYTGLGFKEYPTVTP